MKRLLALAAVVPLLAATGCGGSTTKTVTRIVPAPTVQGHRCSPADEALQCVLPPVPLDLRLPFATATVHGVDFAWGAPSVSTMRQLGAKFGASYFSYDQAKGWTQRADLVGSYHRAGIATVGVWETSANRALAGYSAGVADAQEANRQAAAVGNTYRPIVFAIDCDCDGPSVSGYFQGVHSVLHARDQAYGGYRPLLWLWQHGLVGNENWQTYAWSYSQWLPASVAPLEQWLNGSSVDYDRAIAPAYGQWPFNTPPPPKPCNHACKARKLKPLYVRRTRLRHLLSSRGCRRRAAHHVQLGPKCTLWFGHGVTVNRQIKHLGGH